MNTANRSLPKTLAARAPLTVAPVMEPELQDYAGDLEVLELISLAEKLDR